MELGVGETLYDGLAVVQNISGAPLTLVSVTTSGRSPAVRVATAGVAALSDRTDESVGAVASLPAGMKLTPLAQTKILPRQSSRTRYAIVFTVKGEKPGRWQAPAVLITYRDGGDTRRFEVGYNLTVCVAPEATAEC